MGFYYWGISVLFFIFPSNRPIPFPYRPFYGKGYNFAFISLERLGILFGFHLLRSSIYATIIAQFQFKHIDEVGGFYTLSILPVAIIFSTSTRRMHDETVRKEQIYGLTNEKSGRTIKRRNLVE